jgi:F-type H+-transporting ATPase subunit h
MMPVSRIASRAVPKTLPALTRAFSGPTPIRRADFVQEMYLKELKAYKVPPTAANDHEGNVLSFKVPRTPRSPEEANLANSIKEYEAMTVDVDGSNGSVEGVVDAQAEANAAFQKWLMADEVDEEPVAAHH